MKKTLCLFLAVVFSMIFFNACSNGCIECGEPVGLKYHPDDGHQIAMDDIKGRWYAIGTSMDLEWGKGECTEQRYHPIPAPEGQAVFEETMSWINPEGQFTGINTMLDVNEPYNMLFTKPDSGGMQDVYMMPWTLFAIGSEPADYLALYFCKPIFNNLTIEPFQGFDIVARTQDPQEIQEIENKVLALAEAQGMFTENYVSLPQGPECPEIIDFEMD